MRLALRSDNLAEWLALRAGLVPTPAAEVWAGMALSGVLIAAAQLGLFARLAKAPATASDLAADLGLDGAVAGLLLDFLASSRLLRRRGDRYRLTRSSRRWLDPASKSSVAHFVEANVDYWPWWSRLSEIARTGRPVDHHAAEPDSDYWRRYVSGQLDLAQLGAPVVAKALRLADGARTVLDIGGGHGWYSAELCRRYPQLTATVLDLPGSARVGREIMAQAGHDRVSYVEGDALSADLGGPYDLVLCFNLIHHLRPAETVELLRKARGALVPGGSLAIMDAFAAPSRRRSASASYLGLFMYLSSGAGVYAPAQLLGWLDSAGFAPPRSIPIRRIPGQRLYQASARRE